MDFTTSTSTVQKSIKTRYAIAIAGTALALSVAIGGFTDLTDGGRETPLASSPAKAVPLETGYRSPVRSSFDDSHNQQDELLVYVVGSEAEKQALEQDVASYPEWFGQSVHGVKVRTIVIEPGTDDLIELDRLLPKAMMTTNSGPGLKLVDMR
jgi:hypothetical protein